MSRYMIANKPSGRPRDTVATPTAETAASTHHSDVTVPEKHSML